MRIRHRQLVQCQKNPTEWVSQEINQNVTFYRIGYERCLRDAIHHFHRDENDEETRQYIQKRIRNHRLKDPYRTQDILKRLDAYMHWFQSSGITILKSQVRFNFGIGHGVILGGLISRIDMTLQGYRAILLETIPPQWKEELRMPLIQRGLAHAYGRREDKFEVGIQELDASDLVVNVYSKSELDDAEQLAQQLAEKVANEYAKYM